MLGIDEHEAIFNAALVDARLHIGCDVDEGPSRGHFEHPFFAATFHWWLLLKKKLLKYGKILVYGACVIGSALNGS